MRQISIVCFRELAAFFNSLTAYVILVLFLGLSGFFTWLFGQDIFFMGQASLEVFFRISYWTLFFFIPAITMRLIAEEKRSGTFEMVATKAISDWQFVAGKFFAGWLMVLLSLALTLPYYLTVAWLGPIDHGGTIGGYVALALLGAAYVGLGVFASSLTPNQIIAFLLTVCIGFFFHFIFNLLHIQLSGGWARLFYFLSFDTHFDSMRRGVFDSGSIVFLISVAFTGLFFAREVIAKRNMKA